LADWIAWSGNLVIKVIILGRLLPRNSASFAQRKMQFGIYLYFALSSTQPMYHNVMSPTIARRLGACAHNTSTKCHHVRLSTSSFRQQTVAPSDHQKEHLERLALLQAEDRRLLKPVKAKIGEYQARLAQIRETLTTLPPALQILEGIKSPAYTLVEHRASIAEAIASLDRLKDAKLPTLLAHVEDLELEEYPEPSSDDSEVEFLQRVDGMKAAEREDLLDSLSLEIRALSSQTAESVQRYTGGRMTNMSGSEIEPAKPVERTENPFAKTAARMKSAAGTGSKKKAEDKTKFGLSTDEQFASVIADAAPKNFVKKKKAADANFGLDQDNGDITTWRPVGSGKPKAPETIIRSPSLSSETPSESAWGAMDDDFRADNDGAKPRPITLEPKLRSPSISSETSSGSTWGVLDDPLRPDTDVTKSKPKPKPKPQSHNLNSLQAQLEASWKKPTTF
jgi:hypothetical protein